MRINFRWAAALLIFHCIALAGNTAEAKNKEDCSIADSAISDASSIRKLPIKREVPCLVHQKEQVKQYLLHAIDTKIPPAKLAMEALVYKAIGMIPEQFDYHGGIVDLYLNQIGGYYDPEQGHFVMAGWMPAILQTTVAVHELTHALQDQYFNLEKFMDEKQLAGDALLARSALVEGDATAVMMDYARKLAGQTGLEKEESVETMMLQNVIGSSMVGALNTIPQSMQMQLIFPYTSGLRFAHHLLKQGGYAAIDAAFKRPPRSTEEILHPEKYAKQSPDFQIPDAQALRPAHASSAQLEYEDTLGEFAISTLLANFTPDKSAAAEGAAGWGGDKLAVFEDQEGKQRHIVWRTSWDSEADARDFLRLYELGLKSRFSNYSTTTKSAVSGERVFSVHSTGKDVTLTVQEPLTQ